MIGLVDPAFLPPDQEYKPRCWDTDPIEPEFLVC